MMKKNTINSHFNKAATNAPASIKQKPVKQDTPVKKQSTPSPGLNLNPPASRKSIQNQMMQDNASEKLNLQQSKAAKVTERTSPRVQEFNKAAQVNTQKFNHVAINRSR